MRSPDRETGRLRGNSQALSGLDGLVIFAMVCGLSSVPTRYRVTVRGMPFFVSCGADLFLSALEEDLDGEGRCPVCGEPTLVRLREGRVIGLTPPTAVLLAREVASSEGCLAFSCEDSHLFDRRACAEEWIRKAPGPIGRLYEPQAFLDHCRERLRATERQSRTPSAGFG